MRIATVRRLLGPAVLLATCGSAAADDLGVTLAGEVCRDGFYTLSPLELMSYQSSDIRGETPPEEDGTSVVTYHFNKIGGTAVCMALRASGGREKTDSAAVDLDASSRVLQRGFWNPQGATR